MTTQLREFLDIIDLRHCIGTEACIRVSESIEALRQAEYPYLGELETALNRELQKWRTAQDANDTPTTLELRKEIVEISQSINSYASTHHSEAL